MDFRENCRRNYLLVGKRTDEKLEKGLILLRVNRIFLGKQIQGVKKRPGNIVRGDFRGQNKTKIENSDFAVI